jgi:hypothetical protein
LPDLGAECKRIECLTSRCGGRPRATLILLGAAFVRKYSNAQMRFWELSGGVLRCPDCGRGLVAVSAWKGYTRKDGSRKRHFYYTCATGRRRGKEACSYGRTPNARKIEAEVWEAVKAVLLDPERLERGLDAYLETEMEKDGGTPRRKPGCS